MILNIYCVYDCKVQAYMNPFCLRNLGEATRGFEQIVNDPKSQFHAYPEDYSLYHLGTFDDSGAQLDILPAPVFIAKASQFVKPV